MIIVYGIALASVGFFIVLAEIVSRLKPKMNRELTRKIAHIGSAAAVATWPFYLDWISIRILGVVLTLGVVSTIYLKLTKSIHDVSRKNHGEVLFGLIIILAAFISPTPAIFCAAMLFMGLADGLAAVAGTLWGKSSEYRVFGAKKSWVGSATFYVVALAITAGYSAYVDQSTPLALYIALPLVATLLEAVSRWGLDNVTVPLLVIATLSIL